MQNQTILTISYLNTQGQLSDGYLPQISDEELIKGYKVMLLTRMVDERMITLQRQGSISFALSSLGEEACAVASAAALHSGDWMYPQYREAGVMFWRGFTVPAYIHHMFGDAEDLMFGRQMPNHFGSRALNVVTVSSPIGTKIPHAAGSAYAMKLLKDPTISICYFGEGAASEGDFHTGLNFAAVRKAPVIFFCRNNGYAISTPVEKQYATDGIAPEGIGHGLKTYRIDGNDFFAVYDTVKEARKYSIEGNGPVFIEAMTYRLGAHSTADDPTLYRKEDEVKKWEKCCPILRLRLYLESKGLWDHKKEEEWTQFVNQQIAEGIELAKKTPKPPLASLFEHVYFDMPLRLKEQLKDAQSFFPEEK